MLTKTWPGTRSPSDAIIPARPSLPGRQSKAARPSPATAARCLACPNTSSATSPLCLARSSPRPDANRWEDGINSPTPTRRKRTASMPRSWIITNASLTSTGSSRSSAGGPGEPGPLTPEGHRLLDVMADLGLILDVSHSADEACLESLDRFEGTVIASHANPRARLKGTHRPERFLTDEMIRRLAERGGVVGIVPFNRFLKVGWQESDGKAAVTLDDVLAMIDHVCQVTGSAAHVGLGSDFDGGFGGGGAPAEID